MSANQVSPSMLVGNLASHSLNTHRVAAVLSAINVPRLVLALQSYFAQMRLSAVLLVFSFVIGIVLSIALALVMGSTVLSPVDIWQALHGKATPATSLVLEFRLPRVLLAIFAGMALGLAGCLLQSLCRNRLAGPEMLGVNDGAAAAVLLGLVLSNSGMLGPWWLGPLGAFAACAILLLLSYRHADGGTAALGENLLLVGLGLGCLLRALTDLALSQQSLQHAASLYNWSVGSLAGHDLNAVWPLAGVVVVGLGISLACHGQLRLLQFPPEIARSLGLRLRAYQALALLLALVLAGMAVGVCGPLAFVALGAPAIAAQISPASKLPLIAASSIGAILLLFADMLGRSLLAHSELPVGVVCNVFGGPLLLVMLLKNGRN